MDIHKPKAAHSWREFLIEIGTIICGILIALGLEQIADGLHWRHKVEQAETVMGLELRDDNGPQAYARVVAVGCLDSELNQLEAMASRRADRRAFRKAAVAYYPPNRTWDTESWKATVAADIGPHIGADMLNQWAAPYRMLPVMSRLGELEQRDRATLAAVADAAGPLTEQEVERLLPAISQLRASNLQFGFEGAIFLKSLEDLHLGLSPESARPVLDQARSRFGACAATPDLARLRASGRTSSEGLDQFPTETVVRSWVGLPPKP